MLQQAVPDDLLRFGLIPEFIGRLPVMVALEALDQPTLLRILTEPKNALIKQYQHLFSLENCKLEFTQSALEALAERAMKRDTGARALRAVLDEYMLDIMYELPERDHSGVTYVIDGESIEAGYSLAQLPQRRAKESA
jgi:ATP-dependent Clp protease ATP-binding subunit ClpX